MHVILTGAILLIVLFLITTIGKKINEPFTISHTTASPDVLLDNSLQNSIHEQDVKYGGLNKYVFQTPMASYAQVTNNKRHWDNPENGSALYPPINGTSLYV
jgi:hypothetical protein